MSVLLLVAACAPEGSEAMGLGKGVEAELPKLILTEVETQDDWGFAYEIYNNTDETIDLSGMQLGFHDEANVDVGWANVIDIEVAPSDWELPFGLEAVSDELSIKPGTHAVFLTYSGYPVDAVGFSLIEKDVEIDRVHFDWLEVPEDGMYRFTHNVAVQRSFDGQYGDDWCVYPEANGPYDTLGMNNKSCPTQQPSCTAEDLETIMFAVGETGEPQYIFRTNEPVTIQPRLKNTCAETITFTTETNCLTDTLQVSAATGESMPGAASGCTGRSTEWIIEADADAIGGNHQIGVFWGEGVFTVEAELNLGGVIKPVQAEFEVKDPEGW